jgi:DNA-binding IclR family transcriptional regulator
VLVLETIIRFGPDSPARISELTGLPVSDIDGILERLMQLRYVSRKADRYQGVARPRGS